MQYLHMYALAAIYTGANFQQIKDNIYMVLFGCYSYNFCTFVIEITTQLRCFSNLQKTSTYPLSAAASSAVKSHFLAICTLLPLLSNCRFTSRWTLPAAALTGMLPSLPVISTLMSWFTNNQNINVAIK